MSTPPNRTVPALADCIPPIALSNVDLPAPFGPTRATISPSSTVNVTPSTAGSPPKRFSIPVSSRIATVGLSAPHPSRGRSVHPSGSYGVSGEGSSSVSGYQSPSVLVPSGAGPAEATENSGWAAAISPHSVQLSVNG